MALAGQPLAKGNVRRNFMRRFFRNHYASDRFVIRWIVGAAVPAHEYYCSVKEGRFHLRGLSTGVRGAGFPGHDQAIALRLPTSEMRRASMAVGRDVRASSTGQLESGSATLSSDLPSASTPNLNSTAAAASIRRADAI